ncbi:MAG TPA: response regulator [Puia sp.]
MKNILLIDDDPIFVYLMRRIINSTSYSCEINEFTDGELAINYLNGIHDKTELLPDLIFLDLSMPVMDGWEFLKEYSRLRPGIKKNVTLFIVSSSISPQEVERAKTFRAVKDFLIKPLGKAKVIEIIGNLIEAAPGK